MMPVGTKWRPSKAMALSLLCIGVMLFAGLVYSPLLSAGFADPNDATYLSNDARLWSAEWSWRSIGDLFRLNRIYRPEGTGGYYQPLAAASIRLDAWLTRITSSMMDPSPTYGWLSRGFQFHLTNLLLHVLNVGMVFLLSSRLSGSGILSALTACVFAFHTAQVECVASIAQRMTLLGGFFCLLSLHGGLSARDSRRPMFWMLSATLAYAAAMLCRPLFIALPIVLLTLDIWPYRRTGLRPLLEKLPMFAVLVATAWMQSVVRRTSFSPHSADSGGVGTLLHDSASLIARVFVPFNTSPHQPNTVTVAAHAFGPWFDVTICTMTVAALALSFRLSKPVFAALCGAMLLTIPSLMEAPFASTLLSDPYLYGALIIPIVVLAAWIGARPGFLSRGTGRWTAIGLASATAVFSVHAYAQTFVWQSSRTVYEQTTALHPEWMPGHIGLVESLIEENEFDRALIAAESAANMNPNDSSMQFYLGTVLLLHNDSRASEAVEPLRRALASNREWIECLQNLGVALARCGRSDEAIRYLEQARDLHPKSPGIRLGLGNAYLKVRRFASARREFQEALRRQNDPMAHLGLAIAWAANEEPEFARRHLEAAVAKDPRFSRRAGQSPELRKLRWHPGFQNLIDVSHESPRGDAIPATDSPPARKSHRM